MKITILYDRWEGTEDYPGAAAEEENGQRKTPRRPPKLDREEIFNALTKLGHEVTYHELDGREPTLLALARTKEDLIFNLVESYGGDDTKDLNVAAFLDLLGKRYTGSGPRALHLGQDKVVAKKVVRFHGLLTPFFAVSYRGKLDHAQDIQFPLIVKPTSEDGSIGIDRGSVVTSVKELMERIHYIHDEFDAPALIEEYIDGREIYAAVIGNDKPEALPLVELDFSFLPDGMPKIAGYDVKFERNTEAYRKTRSAIASGMPEELMTTIQQVAVTAYQALELRDYGRIDIRVTDDGKPYVIEANPNPWLSSSAEFCMAARDSGRSYIQTINEIVELATARYRS
ncbi:MAG TPA: ATP-grasp domain-containing protein [Thermoanaerobaculia bacterium]|nr:ATP-grasp domain-containing protein [Thermoanaerobaculia bacterium]